MQPYQADSAALPRPTGDRGTSYHLALAALADDVVGTLARVFAYVGILALLAILGLAAFEQLPRLGDGQLGDGRAVLGSIWTTNDPCDPANQVNVPTRLARYAVARRRAVEPGGSAGQKGQACPPDWLRDPEIVPLRGAL
jgi:hypothetical protein